MDTKTLDFHQMRELLRDPTLVPFLVIWITHGIGGFDITFVLPSVIYDLGLTDTAISQLMTMPAYATVFAILLTLGWLTHSGRMTVWVAGLILELGQIICYILLITIDNVVAKYVFVCIATAATSSFFPIIWPGKGPRSRSSCGVLIQHNANVSNRANSSGQWDDECGIGHWYDQCEFLICALISAQHGTIHDTDTDITNFRQLRSSRESS